MKRMKKAAAWVTGLCMAASLSACSSQQPSAQTTAQATEAQTDASAAETQEGQPTTVQDEEAQTAEESLGEQEGGEEQETELISGGESGKTLVVYFSATGNTKDAAEYIAAATGGDTFELVPVTPYTSEDLNWTDEQSRVSYEHDHEEARAVELVENTVSDWESYDRVFIGYPIWWGIAAWPVNSFIAANDFEGKTVIPFCTSASSGLGESGSLLAEAAGTGNWLEGQRFSSHVTQEEIQEWIEGLGL